MTWDQLASGVSIEKTKIALQANNIEVFIVENRDEARAKALELIPPGSEVMTMSSVTLETLGLTSEFNESGKFNSIKQKLSNMNRETQSEEMNKLGATPACAIGSVHAVTEDGKVLVASNTGSQLPAYAYAAQHVIWMVGTQKIVKNLEEGLKRIYEYCLVRESERMQKIAGKTSFVSKILIVNREIKEKRITMVLIKDVVGF